MIIMTYNIISVNIDTWLYIYADISTCLHSHTHMLIKMCSSFGENALEYTS